VGGGITSDSVPRAEWLETRIKAAPLLALGGVAPVLDADRCEPPPGVDVGNGLVETMLVQDGTICQLSDHLTRLDASCRELFGRAVGAELAGALRSAAAARPGRHRLRVVVPQTPREPVIEVVAAGPAPSWTAVRLVRGRRGCWRHKWADRRWLSALEDAEHDIVLLPLFVTDGPEPCVLETSRSNIAAIPCRGVLVTPPLTEDVLPGVTRRGLLDQAGDRGWRIEIRPLPLAELLAARLVLSLSSIAGAVAVRAVDDRQLEVDAEILEDVGRWLDRC